MKSLSARALMACAGLVLAAQQAAAQYGSPSLLPLPPVTAVDAVAAKHSIAADVQQRIVDAHGTAGVVEEVALCGLYATMGYMVTAFDIAIEEGFPESPF